MLAPGCGQGSMGSWIMNKSLLSIISGHGRNLEFLFTPGDVKEALTGHFEKFLHLTCVQKKYGRS